MTAAYFRRQAVQARLMAQDGDDPFVADMLLRLAGEMEVEADLLEAEAASAALSVSGTLSNNGAPSTHTLAGA